ncbi:MAG: hypothetical protein AAFP90_20825 [Planctomycetota bacterium]
MYQITRNIVFCVAVGGLLISAASDAVAQSPVLQSPVPPESTPSPSDQTVDFGNPFDSIELQDKKPTEYVAPAPAVEGPKSPLDLTPKEIVRLRNIERVRSLDQRMRRLQAMNYMPLRPTWAATPMTSGSRYQRRRRIYYVYPTWYR